MKLTLSWLKEHLDTEAGLDAIAEKLTALGLEVEGVEDKAAALSAAAGDKGEAMVQLEANLRTEAAADKSAALQQAAEEAAADKSAALQQAAEEAAAPSVDCCCSSA